MSTCRLCANPSLESWTVKDAKSAEPLSMSLCPQCSLVQQTDIPSDDELKIYYSHNYREDYKSSHQPKLKHVRRAGLVALDRIAFMKQSGIFPSGQKLIDIGAGGGEFCYTAQKAGFLATGIEPHMGYSEFARDQYGIHIQTGGIADLQADSADIITLFHVLEHLAHPDQVMVKIASILRHEGLLVIEVPNILQADASPHNIYFKAHLYYFSRFSLLAAASLHFDLLHVNDAGNLFMVLRKKTHPSAQRLDPTPQEWAHIRKRFNAKGWWEYLTVGGGLLKPLTRLRRMWGEHRLSATCAKEVLDRLASSV